MTINKEPNILLARERGQPASQDALRNAIFAKGPALPEVAAPLLSGHAIGSAFVVSDDTSLYRASHDLALAYLNQFPTNKSFDGLREVLTAKDFSLGYHAFGSASGINMIIGAVQIKHDLDQLPLADKIGDTRASLMGRLSVAKGGALFGAGVGFAVFRPMAMVGAVKHVAASGFQAPSLLGRVSYGFLFAGVACYAIFFTIFSAIFGIKIYEGVKLRRKINRAKDLASQVGVLQRKLKADEARIREKVLQKAGSKEAMRDQLVDEALASGKEGLRSLMKELGIENVPDEKLKEVIYKAMEAGVEGTDKDSIQQQVEDRLMQIGLQMTMKKVEIKKEKKVQRALTKKGFEAIREIASDTTLANRVQMGDAKAIEKAEGLVNAVKVSNRRKLTENALVLSVFILGILAMVGAVAFTGGLGVLVAAAIMLVFSIAMTGVDVYYLMQSYKSERPAKHDKKKLIVSSLIGVVSFLSMIGLGAAGVLSVGTIPIVIGTILCLIWLGQNGATWAILNRNERRYLEKNPTLESLLEALQKGENQKRLVKMIENLPKEIKEMVVLELTKQDSDLETAISKVISDIQAMKEEHLEVLREALSPLMISS